MPQPSIAAAIRRVGAFSWRALPQALGLCLLVACGGGGGGAVTGSAPTLTLSTLKRLDVSWPTQHGASTIRLLVDPDGDSQQPEGVLADLPGDATGHALEVFLPTAFFARYRLEVCRPAGCVVSPVASLVGNLAAGVGYVKSPTTAEDDHFGARVALSADGQTLAVSTPAKDNGTGEVAVYRREALGRWVLEQVLRAPLGGPDELFGGALALSADGNTLAASAIGESSTPSASGQPNEDGALPNSGAVYVFARVGTAWSLDGAFKPVQAAQFDFFGEQVELSADGRTLVATSAWQPLDFAREVHVYARLGSNWVEQTVIAPAVPDPGDGFGSSISLSADGRWLAIGDPWDDSAGSGSYPAALTNEGSADSGAVHVYTSLSGAWVAQAFLKPGVPQDGARFGQSVDLSSDGRVLVAGATEDQRDGEGNLDPAFAAAGAAHVFERTDLGSTQTDYLKSRLPAAEDRFGTAVAVSGDGLTLAIGAPDDDGEDTGVGGLVRVDGATNSGAVQVYRRQFGAWGAGIRVKPSHASAPRRLRFGDAIALSGDGAVMAVGAPRQSDATSGIGTNPTAYDGGAFSSGAAYLY